MFGIQGVRVLRFEWVAIQSFPCRRAQTAGCTCPFRFVALRGSLEQFSNEASHVSAAGADDRADAGHEDQHSAPSSLF